MRYKCKVCDVLFHEVAMIECDGDYYCEPCYVKLDIYFGGADDSKPSGTHGGLRDD